MAKQFEKATASEKLSGYMMRHRKPIIAGTVFVIGAIVVFAVVAFIMSRAAEKGISAVDTIEYEFMRESAGLSEAEAASRRDSAMAALEPYIKKSGIVGVRANMLAADIAFQRKSYGEAKSYWEQVAAKGKKAYTAAPAYFNIAVCCEELGDLVNAAAYYAKAADEAEFLRAAHARFSEGRVYEAQLDFVKAAEAYNKLNDAMPNDTWAHLAKSRLIALKTEGKIE